MNTRNIKVILRPLYGSFLEIVMILKWLVFKLFSFVIFDIFKCKNKNGFISFANKCFKPMVPYDIYKSLDVYVDTVKNEANKLSVYTEILPIDHWIKGKNVLDLGGGCGYYSQSILDKGAESVHLLEIQKRKVDFATKKYGSSDGITVNHGSAYNMPFENDSFDTIFSHTVFEHLTEMDSCLDECFRVLKDNGRMMISFNYFHHYGGSHLFPYIHFPWANWLIDEESVCSYWSEQVSKDIARGWSYYDESSLSSSLGSGSEMNLNKLTFDDFESLLVEHGFTVVKKISSGALVKLFPFLSLLPKIKYPLTGTVFYEIRKA